MTKKRNVDKIGALFGGVSEDDVEFQVDEKGSNPETESRLRKLEVETEQSIIRTDERHWRFKRFELTTTTLIPPDDLMAEEVQALGFALSAMGGAINFWLGDWANLVIADAEASKQEEYGEDAVLSEEERHHIYEELVDKFSLDSAKSLRQYSSVCRIIPPSNRIDGVHYTNHQLVAFLPKELKGQEQKFLRLAFEENLSKRELEETIKAARLKLLPKESAPIFDPKPVLKRLKRLSGVMLLSDDARLTKKHEKQYREDIQAVRELLDEMEQKLD